VLLQALKLFNRFKKLLARMLAFKGLAARLINRE